jgi:hypothetical protein
LFYSRHEDDFNVYPHVFMVREYIYTLIIAIKSLHHYVNPIWRPTAKMAAVTYNVLYLLFYLRYAGNDLSVYPHDFRIREYIYTVVIAIK